MAKSWQRGPALYVSATRNEKMGPVDATYAPIGATCPRTCGMHPIHGDGSCYASVGPVAFTERRLADHAHGYDSATAARAEARAIDASYGRGPVPAGRPLRIHVSGDARTEYAAGTIGAAVSRRTARGGGPAWTYTHAARTVRRSAWGPDVSVLGSVESTADADAVRAQGYAPAVVVAQFPAGARAWTEHGVRWIPCPAQTRDDVTCESCRLCWRADDLHARGAGIAFEAHGTKSRALAARLEADATRPAGRRALPLVA